MPKKFLILVHICIVATFATCSHNATEFKWHEEKFHRWAVAEPGFFEKTGFKKIPSSKTNLSFTVSITPKEFNRNQILLNGTGVATADVDGDGLPDIYFTQLNGSNKLYKNLGGFQFKDITEQAGVSHPDYYSTGALFADVNGDRNPDLLVTTLNGKNAVYINNGHGHFKLKKDSGLTNGNGSTTMTMADIDNDGDLDLFIANNKKRPVYNIFEKEKLTPKNLVKRVDRNKISGKTRYEFRKPYDQYYQFIYRKNKEAVIEEKGEYNQLYLNDGTGRFTDVTDQSFIKQNGEGFADLAPEWSLTARFQDLNGDQLPDLYVCNDYFSPDRIWINQGNGQFKEIDNFAIRSFSYSSMGVDISDINRDGNSDIFVTEMLSQDYKRQASQHISTDLRPGMIVEPFYQPQYMHNSMYLNRGDNTFQEIAYYSGLEASEWSWATRFFDVDLDGYEDLIINTGFPYDAMNMDYSYKFSRYKGAVNLDEAPLLELKNKIFRNNGDLIFSDKSEQWGFQEADVSYGLATADFDNDGDLDLVISRFRSEAAIFENRSTAARIAVSLRGQSPNTQGIGAKVILKGGPVRQSKEVTLGGDYLSGSVPQLMFAANADNRNHTIKVKWANGKTSIIDSVAANRIYEIYEPEKNDFLQSSLPNARNDELPPVFKDLSREIDHIHQKETYNDFERQPLLTFKISSEGPGVAWIDFDQDNDDDLFIGGGTTDKLSVYENRGNTEFRKIESEELNNTKIGDPTSILGWASKENVDIIVGNSNYELTQEDVNVPGALHFSVANTDFSESQTIPGMKASAGPVAAADYDGDGDIDLFVGGRVMPGMYPLSVSSKIFENNNGSFTEDLTNGEEFDEIGLTTGAVFSDHDSDGDPDLFVSTEWGPVRLFENQNGTYREKTEEVGLSDFKGRWSNVAAGDFNNDGLIDIVATNLGKNLPYQPRSDQPINMYYDDFNTDGWIEIIEASYDDNMGAYVPMRKLYKYSVFSSILRGEITTFDLYAQRSLKELLNISLNRIPSKQMNTVQHMLFLNTGEEFEVHSLPAEAQFTIAMGAIVADYNNDGNEDLFLSQNYFDVQEGFPRQDAGRGMLLKGDGMGNFEAVSAKKSGIKMYGQQRGAAFSDFNKDGKVDLVVTQRDSTTKLYLNNIDRRGFRVRLKGPDQNKGGIGSALRLVYKDGTKGPLREMQAGSGHYSMNSLVAVLGIKDKANPVQLEVYWYDGKETIVPIEPNKWRYIISHPSI